MNLLKEVLNIRQKFADYLSDWYSGKDMDNNNSKTTSGVDVEPNDGLGVIGVWACVGLIADMLAMLPIHIYKREKNGKIKNREHILYDMLKNKPNDVLTSFEFKRFMQVQILIFGAGFAEIVRSKAGYPVSLFPIPSYAVKVKEKNNKIVYTVQLENILEPRVIRPENMLVMRGLNSSIFEWKSPIAVHRETIGFDIALRTFGSSIFGQGTNPSGVISAPSGITIAEKDKPAYMKAINKAYSGLGNSSRLMILDHGLKFERIAMPPEDAQYIETKQFTLADICRIYRVPLHLIQFHEKSTTFGTGLEEINNGFLTFTLQPHITQWEQEINSKLFFNDPDNFAEFSYDTLLRAKLLDRYQAYSLGKQWGFLSTNDIRNKENMNSVENGDIYLQPLNMIDTAKADQILLQKEEKNNGIDPKKPV